MPDPSTFIEDAPSTFVEDPSYPPIQLDPLQKAQLGYTGPRIGPLGPADPEEVIPLYKSLIQPPIAPPRFEGRTTLGKIGAGFGNVASGLYGAVASPVGLATLPLLAESAPARAAFAGLAAQQAGQSLVKGFQDKNLQDIVEGVGTGLLAASMVPKGVSETTPKVPIEELPATPTETGLRPAIRLMGGNVEVGDAGKVHEDIIKENDLKAKDIDQRGFVDESGTFKDRETVAQQVTPTTEEGRAHSTDLPEAKPESESRPQPFFETIIPAEDIPLGFNSSGERIYQRTSNGEVYRMVMNRKDRPDGYPDFGGDLNPIEPPTPEAKTQPEVKPVVQKVQKEVTKVAKTEGQRPAVEVKTELIKRLEQAIKDAPEGAGNESEKITIDIPGDGVFRVVNGKLPLQAILERAKKIRTDSGKPSGVPTKAIKFSSKAIAATAKEPKIVGMGGATPEEFEQPGTYVSNMFAAIDRDRVSMGKPPMEAGKVRTWDEDNQTALAKMNRQPDWIPGLIKEVLDNPRSLQSWENAGLVWHRQKLVSEYNNSLKRIAQAFDDGREADLTEAKVSAANFEDQLEELDRAVGRGGTGSEAGRSLQAQKMAAGEDFSLIEMRLQRRAAKGGAPLTPKEDAEVEKIQAEYQKRIADLQAHVAAQDQRMADMVSRQAFEELQKKQPKASDYVIKVAERWVKTLDTRADAARERIKARMGRFSAGVDPTVLVDLAEIGASHIAHVGLDFAKWSAKMIEDIGEAIRPHLNEVYTASQKAIENLAVPAEVKQRITKTPETADTIRTKIAYKLSKSENADVSYYVQKLARLFVKEGIKDRDQLIDAVHGVLLEIKPEMTRREAMDAISGYGQFKRLTKDQISVELRDLKGQMQQVAKLEDMAAKTAPLKTGIERRVPSDEERRLITLVNKSKLLGGYEITDPATQLKSALQTWKTNARNRITDLNRKISEGDYSKPVRSEIHLDPEAVNLRAELERTKKTWLDGLRKLERSQRPMWRKAADAFVRWERAFKLSAFTVFGKLTAAAITRVGATLAEEVVGGIQSKLPGISTIAKQAPREGGFNAKAIAKGLVGAIKKGKKDAWDTARKGATDMDVVYGGKLLDKDWANFFGQLHGAFKAPVKRGEIELSLEKRIEHAIRTGSDPTDPFVQTKLITQALNDGYRSIFMQRGFFSDWFNTAVNAAEQSKRYPVAGELSARALRFLFPVVRVPLNIVGEAATGIHGLPTASLRTMVHVIRGDLNNLDPVVADSIMRQFKKGSIGLGLIALGYLNPQSVGGYDWREKRRPGSVKAGGFQLYGEDIPRWMTHAPWFELMQFGATIRHVKEQHLKGGAEKGMSEGAWAAALGMLEETPFVNEWLRMAKATESAKARSTFLGQLAESTVVPQAVSSIARATDPEKRVPSTFIEHIESGIPGLRQNVPTGPPPSSFYPK